MPRTWEPPDDPALEAGVLLGLLWRANHELELLSKQMMRHLGVSGPQRMVLRIVRRNPGVSATGICSVASIHPSTLTGILERLVRGGLVQRLRDSEDGRRARLTLTREGHRVAEPRRGTVESAITASIAELSPEDRQAVRRWLSSFSRALEEERTVLAGAERDQGDGADG